MRRLFAEGAWAQWGLLISACALAGVLVLASWSNHQAARSATHALHIGEARIFEREIMSALRRGDSRTGSSGATVVLDSLLAQQESEGLRYIALLDGSGGIAASAGASLAGPAKSATDPGEEPGHTLSLVGSRVRVTLSRPRGPMPPDVPIRERRFSGIIFEFEPLIAMHLMARAGRLLAFGLAAAALMMFVAFISWHVSRRYERAMRRSEHERRLSLIGEMSAVLAHEIRNPLASLKGHAQLLAEHLAAAASDREKAERPAAAASDREKAERVVLEATRLETLTTDLLDFVRSGPLDRRPADPATLLRAAANEVDPAGFDLDLTRAPERWPVDGPRLHQALTNLLRNAHQASPDGARRPQVSMAVAGERLIVTIRDFGSGLPQGQEDRVFDPFFTTRATGTGLGLAVARRIAELHGGELTAANHAEGGASFTLALPGERG